MSNSGHIVTDERLHAKLKLKTTKRRPALPKPTMVCRFPQTIVLSLSTLKERGRERGWYPLLHAKRGAGEL